MCARVWRSSEKLPRASQRILVQPPARRQTSHARRHSSSKREPSLPSKRAHYLSSKREHSLSSKREHSLSSKREHPSPSKRDVSLTSVTDREHSAPVNRVRRRSASSSNAVYEALAKVCVCVCVCVSALVVALMCTQAPIRRVCYGIIAFAQDLAGLRALYA
jgi:hypothetical protein